jgi:hypothetical protein
MNIRWFIGLVFLFLPINLPDSAGYDGALRLSVRLGPGANDSAEHQYAIHREADLLLGRKVVSPPGTSLRAARAGLARTVAD